MVARIIHITARRRMAIAQMCVVVMVGTRGLPDRGRVRVERRLSYIPPESVLKPVNLNSLVSSNLNRRRKNNCLER